MIQTLPRYAPRGDGGSPALPAMGEREDERRKRIGTPRSAARLWCRLQSDDVHIRRRIWSRWREPGNATAGSQINARAFCASISSGRRSATFFGPGAGMTGGSAAQLTSAYALQSVPKGRGNSAAEAFGAGGRI